jgi:hypothetical protein
MAMATMQDLLTAAAEDRGPPIQPRFRLGTPAAAVQTTEPAKEVVALCDCEDFVRGNGSEPQAALVAARLRTGRKVSVERGRRGGARRAGVPAVSVLTTRTVDGRRERYHDVVVAAASALDATVPAPTWACKHILCVARTLLRLKYGLRRSAVVLTAEEANRLVAAAAWHGWTCRATAMNGVLVVAWCTEAEWAAVRRRARKEA